MLAFGRRSFLCLVVIVILASSGVLAFKGQAILPAHAGDPSTYTNRAARYSIQVPSGWHVIGTVRSSAVGSAEAALSPTLTRLQSNDNVAFINILARPGAAKQSTLKSSLTKLIKGGPPLVGGIQFTQSLLSGVLFLTASATGKIPNGPRVQGFFLAASHRTFSYYLEAAIIAGGKSASERGGDVVSMFNTVRLI